MKQEIYYNPINNLISKSVENTKDELFIAVPFLSSYGKSILSESSLSKIKSKKLLTCFNEFNINSFDLDTLKCFLDSGMEIRFNNNIHLKLYLFDDEGFTSSSNLTKTGFENSVELTSSINKNNLKKCKDFFKQIWEGSKDRKITHQTIEENYSKYQLLRKRTQYQKPKPITVNTTQLKISNFEVEDLIDHLFQAKQDFSYFVNNALIANKDREIIRNRIKKGFNPVDFYSPKEHKKRKQSLYYRLMYGKEGFNAGTGLRENQFKDVFQHEQFPEIMAYIYPPMINKEDWNLKDKDIFREYCRGIFEFRIPQYAETMPIRLASYFYPQNFLPIFKLSHLEKICKILGMETDAKQKGDKLFAYNWYLSEKMKSIPFDNYVKSSIAYQLFFTVELYERLENGEEYEIILKSQNESWRRDYIKRGKELIEKINPTLSN